MSRPSLLGGASTYLDGFGAAEKLREVEGGEEAFQVLSETEFSYRSVDEEKGWHLEAMGRVILRDPLGGGLKAIRHNDLDRMGALPPWNIWKGGRGQVQDVDRFYERVARALLLWDEVINEEGRRMTIRLDEGECTIVHNSR